MKLTEAQYKALLAARGASTLGVSSAVAHASSKALSASDKAIESLRQSRLLTKWEPDTRFVAAFDGARLLSLNELLRLDLRVINRYRKLWHERAYQALLMSGSTFIDGAVRLTLFRQGKRLVDNDGLAASFKFAIDGFKEAGLISDDNPMVVQNIPLMQRQGNYIAALMFESSAIKHKPQLIQELIERNRI